MSVANVNLDEGLGGTVREAPTKNGPADYLLCIGGKAAGVIEAKPAGYLPSAGRARLPTPFTFGNAAVG